MGIGSLTVGIRADTYKARKNVNSFRKDLKEIGPAAAIAKRGVGGLATGIGALGGQLAGLATLGFVTHSITKQFKEIDGLAKTSDKLAMDTEKLGGLRHAAEQTGVEVNQLDTGIQRMTRRVSEAAKGTGEAKGALAELGLEADKLNRMSPDQQFKEIADSIKDVRNETDKVRLAAKLFDSEGVALINTLNLGASGLEAMQKQAEALGITISRFDAKRIEDANDAIDRMSKSYDGAAKSGAIALAPVIEKIAEAWENNFVFMTKGLNGLDELDRARSSMERARRDAELMAEATRKETEAIKEQQEAMKERERLAKNYRQHIDGLSQRIKAAQLGDLAVKLDQLREGGASQFGIDNYKRAYKVAQHEEAAASQRNQLAELEQRLKHHGKSMLETDRDKFLDSAATKELAQRGKELFGKLIEAEKAAEHRLRMERESYERQREVAREAADRAKEFESKLETRADIAGRGNPGVLDARTREGYAALRSSIRRGEQQKILEVGRQQLEVLKEIAAKEERELETYSIN